jgi:hypothetical protein
MNPISKRKSLIASSIALALGASGAQAALVTDLFGTFNFSTDSANFTMLDPNGNTMGPDGGTNDVLMTWDGNGYNASSDYTGPGLPGSAANMTLSSSDMFFGSVWMAHDIQVFLPGAYSFDVTLQTLVSPNGANGEAGMLNVTVPTGMLGMHMLWDWSSFLNVDMFMVLSPSSVFGAGIGRSTTGTISNNACDGISTMSAIKNCLFDGAAYFDGKPSGTTAGKPAGNKVWMLASTDGDGDGVMGIPMAANGPFPGFNANFNASMASTPDAVVPVPAAVWLFGSGLLSLVGIARRKKKA